MRGRIRSWLGRISPLRRFLEREEQFRVAFDLSPDAVTISRMCDGVYVAANEGFTRLTGWTEAEMVGHSSIERGLWADPEQRARLVGMIVKGQPVNDVECVFRRKDGSTLVGLISSRPITVGGQQYLLAITRDVSARKSAEAERAALQEQLRQAQKLEAIGRLAGGVAHDFNNILTSILASTSFIEASIGPEHPALADARQIREDAHRAADLTRQLLTFARRQVVEPRVTRVDERARAMEPMLRRVLRESVQLETRYDPGCWPVFIDPGQLEQVLLNLAVNARDAMPRGGRLAVTVENTTLEPEGAAPLELEPGGYVRLTARDDGVGMEPEVCSRVFEPFFTTKEGRSFGLGLSTCYGIVRQAGGAISVTSAPGAGATFRVHLPRTTAARPVAASEVAEPKTTRGTETVIIVEDEPSVRRIAVRALSSLGYRVLEAETRAAAEALFGDHVGPIEAAILDVALPDGNGRDVAATLARTRPQSRVLFVSGYAGDLAGPHGVLDPSVAFLPKPYTPEQLARRLRALLDSDAATT